MNKPFSILLCFAMSAFYCSISVAGTPPGLAPPLDHWAFKLSPASQTTTVSITLQIADAAGNPSTLPTEVLAICQPWGYRQHLGADVNGRLNLRGPIGDWTFHSCVRSPTGPVLFTVQQLRVTQNLDLKLRQPGQPVPVVLANESGADRLAQLRSRPLHATSFIPMLAPGAPPSMTGGAYPPGPQAVAMMTAPGEDCIFSLVASPSGSDPGYALFARHRPDDTTTSTLNEQQLATIAVEVDDWPVMHLALIALDQEEIPIGFYVRLPGAGAYEIKVRPGVWRIGLVTQNGDFVPVTRTLGAGGRVQLASFRGPFSAAVEVLAWHQGYLSVWFDIQDSQGNYLNYFPLGSAHLTLNREGVTVFDGPIERSTGRCVEVIRDWGVDWADKPVDFDYQLDSAMTGAVRLQGQLQPHQTIDARLKLVHQTALFEVFAREQTENGVRVAGALESAHGALADNIAGPVRPSNGGRFRVQFTSPWGLAWSSGDTLGLDIYAAHWFWPTACGEGVLVMLHEFGHSYSLVPPRTPPNWGESEGQGFATWLAYQSIENCYGERALQMERMNQNTEILSAPTGAPIDGFQFILNYIDQRFGAAVNREAYRILYTGQGSLRARIEQNPNLKTEHERLAVLHSYLTSRNLAWLYRWGHFNVSDETVRQALPSSCRDWSAFR